MISVLKKITVELSPLLLLCILVNSIVLPEDMLVGVNDFTLRERSTSLSKPAIKDMVSSLSRQSPIFKSASSGEKKDEQPQAARPQDRELGDEFIIKKLNFNGRVLLIVTGANSYYRLEEGEGVKVKEEFHLARVTDERREESIRANIFKTLLTDPTSKAAQFFLRRSQRSVAKYMVPRIRGYEAAGDYWRASHLSGIASRRFLSEGDIDRAEERVTSAVADLKLYIDRTTRAPKAVMNALLLRKEAKLHEDLKILRHLKIAVGKWEEAGEAYNELAKTAKSKEGRKKYLKKSAMCIENGAKLQARILYLLDSDEDKETRKISIASDFSCAAIRWFHAGRFKDSLSCLNESVALDRYLKNRKNEIMDLALMARCSLRLHKIEDAFTYAFSAISLSEDMLRTGNLTTFEIAERNKGIVKERWFIAECYFRSGDSVKAAEFAKTALEILDKSGLHDIWDGAKKYEGYLLRFIVYSSFKLKKYDECCKEAKKVFSLLMSRNNKSVAADILSLKGRASMLSGKYIDAYKSYENSAMLHEEVGALEYASKDWAYAALAHVNIAKLGVTPDEHYIKAGYCDRRSAELNESEGKVDMAIQHYLFAYRNFSYGYKRFGRDDCWNRAFNLTKDLVANELKTGTELDSADKMIACLRNGHQDIFDVETEKQTIRLIKAVYRYFLRRKHRVDIETGGNKELEAIDSAA